MISCMATCCHVPPNSLVPQIAESAPSMTAMPPPPIPAIPPGRDCSAHGVEVPGADGDGSFRRTGFPRGVPVFLELHAEVIGEQLEDLARALLLRRRDQLRRGCR